MKVRTEEGKVIEVKPRSPVGSQLRSGKPGDQVNVGGLVYTLVADDEDGSQ